MSAGDSAVGAESRTTANDAFRYIGSGAFTGSADELRYETGPGGTRLLGDVNGDGVADFEIVLQNTPPPAATDFFF